MTIRILGVILVVSGCGGIGFRMASQHKRLVRILRQLASVLDYMECELQYRLTPLPELCRQGAGQCRGSLRQVLLTLTKELEDQLRPNVAHCMQAALRQQKNLPEIPAQLLSQLGNSMGRFDVQGQLRAMEAVRLDTRRVLQELSADQATRVRSYQTLGLCAGAALAILLV